MSFDVPFPVAPAGSDLNKMFVVGFYETGAGVFASFALQALEDLADGAF